MFTFWQRWLQVVFGLFIVFGVVFAFFGTSSFLSPMTGPIFAAFWPSGPPSPETLRFAQFTFGIMGALTVGLGVFGWFITRFALAKGIKWAWVALFEGVVLWFLVDSAMSIYTGAWVNAVFNGGFFLMAMIPLAALWPLMRSERRDHGADAGLTAPNPAH